MRSSRQSGDVGFDKIAGPYSGSRVLPLAGGQNFRDLGGYSTCDGRRVKWGRVFRSGSLSRLTPADFDYLSGLRIRTICDLRSTGERRSEPNKWYQVANIGYWAREYDVGFGELRKLLASGLSTPEDARAAMLTGYRQLPFDHAVAYRELFARLAAGEVPLVVNCSAGKDRAGTAAALILSALGVPREAVIEDYLLTDEVLDIQKAFLDRAHERKSSLANHSAGVVNAILKSDAGYLRAGLAAIEDRHGTITTYLQEELGVTPQALRVIQDNLLDLQRVELQEG
jgi:protein-tyrosine phosphatase